MIERTAGTAPLFAFRLAFGVLGVLGSGLDMREAASARRQR